MPDESDNLPVRREVYLTNNDINLMARIAKTFAMSGLFDDVTGEIQAYVKIAAGREMGLQPFQAMNAIDIIKGKPVFNSGFLASQVKAHEHYDYRVQHLDNDRAEIAFFQDGVEIGVSTFSMDDAKAAGLAGNMYGKYPRNMLFARAMSNGVAFFCPDATNVRTYIEGELGPERAAQPDPTPVPGETSSEETLDVEPEPEPEMGTAVKEPMKGTASATLDPETAALEDVPETVDQKTATGLNVRAAADQAAAAMDEPTPPPSDEVKAEPAARERTAAQIAADKKHAEPPSTAKILTEQEQNVAKVRQLVVTDLKGEDRKECHDAMKYLSMWGEGAPLELWKAFGKKALEWKTLKPALAKAVKDELARVEKLQAAAPEEPPFGGEPAPDADGQERIVDVEPEPEAPWAGDEPS